jgi:hypothetical protein
MDGIDPHRIQPPDVLDATLRYGSPTRSKAGELLPGLARALSGKVPTLRTYFGVETADLTDRL